MRGKFGEFSYLWAKIFIRTYFIERNDVGIIRQPQISDRTNKWAPEKYQSKPLLNWIFFSYYTYSNVFGSSYYSAFIEHQPTPCKLEYDKLCYVYTFLYITDSLLIAANSKSSSYILFRLFIYIPLFNMTKFPFYSPFWQVKSSTTCRLTSRYSHFLHNNTVWIKRDIPKCMKPIPTKSEFISVTGGDLYLSVTVYSTCTMSTNSKKKMNTYYSQSVKQNTWLGLNSTIFFLSSKDKWDLLLPVKKH